MVHYLPVLIRNRFGDEISIDPKEASSNGLNFTATWSRGGSVMASVQVTHQGPGVSVAADTPLINGYGGNRTTVRAQVQYSVSNTPSYMVDFIPLMAYPLSVRPWDQASKTAWDEIRRTFQPIQVTLDQTGESVSFNYQPAQPLIFPSYVPVTLESITLPGRKISFTWAEYVYRRGSNYPNKYFELVPPDLDWQCNDLWHGAAVTRIKEQDLTGHSGSRTTSYSRTLPVPDPARNNGPFWSSTAFSTRVNHPDGRQVDHWFAGPQPGVYDVENTPGQLITIAGARKQLLLRTIESKPGEGWSVETVYGGGGFSGVNNWINPYWNSAGLQDPAGRSFRVPYATHTEITTQDGGSSVHKVQTQSSWDAVNVGWQASKTEAGGLTRRVDRTFQFNANSWLGPLVTTEAATGHPPKAMGYNPDGTLNSDNRASGQQVLAHSYGNGLPHPSAISLTGSAGSGTAGASYSYDGYGHLNRIQLEGLPYGTSQVNDALGRPTSQTDVNGNTTLIQWDSAGRLKAILPSGGELPTTYSYPSSFQVIATRGLGTTTYSYDGFGQLVSIRKPSGHTKTFTYDAAGHRTFESVWGGAAGTSTHFDGLGRPTRIQDPNGLVTSLSHGALSKAVTVGNAITHFGYDALHRLTSVVDALGYSTTYSYDDGDRITGVDQHGGGMSQHRSWTYNGLGWLTGLTQPESGTTRYSNFIILGKPQTTDYNGRTISTSYDPAGRARSVTGYGVDQAFVWDGGPQGNGKLQSSRDGNIILEFGYGGLNGRIDSLTTKMQDPIQGTPVAPFLQSFGYNSYGHRISATLPSGRSVAYDLDLVRDVPAGVSAQGGMPGSWDAISAMATVTDFNAADIPTSIGFANSARSTFVYDADQTRLTKMTHAKSGAPNLPRTWNYIWDGAGRLTSDGEDSYSYDELGRLLSANIKLLNGVGTIAQSFTYDPFGNQVSSTHNAPPGLSSNFTNFSFSPSAFATTNRLPAFTSAGGATGAVYDPQGNLTGIFKEVGNTARSMNMTYDALGRVMSMFDNERGVTEKYFYTAEGLRTRIETWQGGVLVKVTIKLYNDQRQLVSEYETAPPPAVPLHAARAGK
jgi:YD repeat-containing protein